MLTYKIVLPILFVDIAIIDITIVMKWFRLEKVRVLISGVLMNFIAFVDILVGMAYLDNRLPEGPFLDWANMQMPLHLMFPCVLFIHGMGILSYEISSHYKRITRSAIQNALNELDSGLMYVTKRGRIALINRKMESLACDMMGKYPRNGNAFWDTVSVLDRNEKCKRIDFTRWPSFVFENGEVWSFQRVLLDDSNRTYYEILAKDVTLLYAKRRDVEEEMNKLKNLQGELSKVLRSISEAGNEEELLNYKIRIHDQLGNAILRTRKTLRDKTFEDENVEEILHVWDNTVKGFEQNIAESEGMESSGLDEVYAQAKALGIDFRIDGKFPERSPVCVRAVREAMYNSIRHAYANAITVESYRAGDGYHIRIYDDGQVNVTSITEGGGLKSLRKEIEDAGGSMVIGIWDGVEINIFYPTD